MLCGTAHPAEIPADLRARLEIARLDLLALFRALDRMNLTPEQIPQRLIQQLFELDADCVEALWGLDQPPGKLNLKAMLRDPLAALDQLAAACSCFRKTSRRKLNPLSLNSNSRSVGASTPLKLTTWSLAGAPNSVEYPRISNSFRPSGAACYHSSSH
jgi:hypothetical protein